MKFAYADPPYFGQGKKHYGKLHADAADCDTIEWHRALVMRLVRDYPDGWALSASAPSLRDILPICPPCVRVAAWCKSFASFKPNVNPAYCWEPVIFRGGRKRDRMDNTVRDFAVIPIALKRGFSGAKPEAFTRWMMELLNVRPGDVVDDLFPGSGGCSAEISRPDLVFMAAGKGEQR